ncbi:MAG TPA: cystathionine beta-lyase, partial [Burkholderiales bacterium]|nr:cystathionine beta-lyase [Burkholderiales bacterium]
TKVIHSGRHPERFEGAVNPPVFHASTILSQSLEEWDRKKADRARGVPGTYYGRIGTPTTHALEEAIRELEGGACTVLVPSGLAACAVGLLSAVQTGDHVLITDNIYGPTRTFAVRFLARFGVETTFFDPMVGAGVAALMRDNTRAVVVESPGSLSFEMQDVPAIAAAAHARGATVLMDNTWATPLYFKPLAHGVDLSIQAATKYVVGHSDAMLGTITANERAAARLRAAHYELGQTVGPDDANLASRGLRTMAVRLARHWETGVRLAEWIARQPEVERVLHPALPSDPGHALWKRDFAGASGLFGVVLKPMNRKAYAALIDSLELFGIGASWGGYESLIMPMSPGDTRSATQWPHAGPCFRIHAGLENPDDLLADLDAGFRRLRESL